MGRSAPSGGRATRGRHHRGLNAAASGTPATPGSSKGCEDPPDRVCVLLGERCLNRHCRGCRRRPHGKRSAPDCPLDQGLNSANPPRRPARKRRLGHGLVVPTPARRRAQAPLRPVQLHEPKGRCCSCGDPMKITRSAGSPGSRPTSYEIFLPGTVCPQMGVSPDTKWKVEPWYWVTHSQLSAPETWPRSAMAQLMECPPQSPWPW